VIQLNGLRLSREEHLATYQGADIGLTVTEFRILWELAAHPGRVFTRALLIGRALGEHAAVSDRAIDAHIRTIRTKLGAGRMLVQTRRGVGYSFAEAGQP
jgi:DNA-binding response OmpR family regulator